MSNDNSDPRMSKEAQYMAGSMFGVELKKKHDVDFLDDFDSGFDLSAITGIPDKKKVEPVVSTPVVKAAAIEVSPQISLPGESEVRLIQDEDDDSGAGNELEVDFSWEEQEGTVITDDFGFGLEDEGVTQSKKKKVVKKVKKKNNLNKPVKVQSSGVVLVDSTIHEPVEKIETREADWQAANTKPATTQAKDNFWDPLEEWSWDDNTNLPVAESTAKPAKREPEIREKQERPVKEKRDHKGQQRKPDRPKNKAKELVEDNSTLLKKPKDDRGNYFAEEEFTAGSAKSHNKKLNLNDLLEDRDHSANPIDDDIDLEEVQEVETDDFADDYPTRRSPPQKKSHSQVRKSHRQHAIEADEDLEDDYEEEFTDEDFDDAEFNFDEVIEDEAREKASRQKPEQRKPERKREVEVREKPRGTKEVKELVSKPAKKSATNLNIPTWEEAISIVLEANAHLMTQPSRSSSRGGSAHYSSSGNSSGESRGGKKRGKRGPQRRPRN